MTYGIVRVTRPFFSRKSCAGTSQWLHSSRSITALGEIIGGRDIWPARPARITLAAMATVGIPQASTNRRLGSRRGSPRQPGREADVGIFKSKKRPESGTGAAETSSGAQDFMQREMEKIFGSRGPAHLVALIPDPGVAEPGRVTWVAIPSWDQAHVVADEVNAQAPALARAGRRLGYRDAGSVHPCCVISSHPACAATAAWPRTAAVRRSASRSVTVGPHGRWNILRRPYRMPRTTESGRRPKQGGLASGYLSTMP